MGLEVDAEFPPVKPIRIKSTKGPAEEQGEEEMGGLHTPKSEGCMLKPLLVCPPAPRKKPRPPKRKLDLPPQGFFAVPCDLASIFVAVAAPTPKKIKAAG